MFDYNRAFSRNIGWVTEQEQLSLKDKTIAIAGAGGVGGEHLVTMARLGVGRFHISDFDHFEVHNFNRQAGAFMSTIGQEKCQVMENIAKDINPEVHVENFNTGIAAGNVDAFLNGVDLYIDSLDFFALEARKLVFEKCRQLGIPVITAAPLGLGCAFLCFMPDTMSYEEYFRFNDANNETEEYIKFLIGLSPAMLQRSYLVDPSRADFNEKRGPSLPMAVKLCAGIAGGYALKILLKRGELITAPYGLHFDVYKNTMRKTWRPWGNRNPLQRVAFSVAKRILTR